MNAGEQRLPWCTLVHDITQRGIFIYIGLTIPLSTLIHLPTVLFYPLHLSLPFNLSLPSLLSEYYPLSGSLGYSYERASSLILWLNPAGLTWTKLSLQPRVTCAWKQTSGSTSVGVISMFLLGSEQYLEGLEVRILLCWMLHGSTKSHLGFTFC